MNILITGAAGFIGSYLSRELLLRGDNVIGIDNFSDYYPRVAKEFNLDLVRASIGQDSINSSQEEIDLIWDKLYEYNPIKRAEKQGEFSFIECDIREIKELDKIFKEYNIDCVVHLAAMAGVPMSIKKPLLYTSTNIDGTVNLLELSARYDTKKFVFGSSSSVYGNTREVPFNESQDVDKPVSQYAATKRMGEIMCSTYSTLYEDLHVICARIYGPIFGPLQRPYGMAAQRFIRQVYNDQPITIYGDGLMERDSTYIDDEVTGLIRCIDVEDIKYDLINIGTGDPVSVLEMANFTIELMGKGELTHIVRPSTEVDITFADTRKAEKILGFKSKMSYLDGLKRQIEVFKMMPDWYKDFSEY